MVSHVTWGLGRELSEGKMSSGSEGRSGPGGPGGGKRKNVDKRREKSKYAARDRRGREAEIFGDVEEMIPLCGEQTITHVDRIAVLRLAAAFCRVRKTVPQAVARALPPADAKAAKAPLDEEAASLCLPGFLCVLDKDSLIVYVSHGVSKLLGLTQTDLVGLSLEDFVKAGDLASLREEAAARVAAGPTAETTFQTTMRMKSVLTARGRNLNLRSATYKALRWTVRPVAEQPGLLLLLAEPIMAALTAAQQQTLDAHAADTFVTRHSPDLRFSYAHERVHRFLGHDIKALIGSSFFALVHPADLPAFAESVRELHDKGQARTGYYRLLAKDGEAIWVQTEASVSTHSARGGGKAGVSVVACHQVVGRGRVAEWFLGGGAGQRRLGSPADAPPPLKALWEPSRPARPLPHPPARPARPTRKPALHAGQAPPQLTQDPRPPPPHRRGPGRAALRQPLPGHTGGGGGDSGGGGGGGSELPKLLSLDEILSLDDEPGDVASFQRIREWLLADYEPAAAEEKPVLVEQQLDGRGEGAGHPAAQAPHPAPPPRRGPAQLHDGGGERGRGGGPHVPQDHPDAPGRRLPQAAPAGGVGQLRLGGRDAGPGEARPARLPPQVLPRHELQRLPGHPLPGRHAGGHLLAPLPPAHPPGLHLADAGSAGGVGAGGDGPPPLLSADALAPPFHLSPSISSSSAGSADGDAPGGRVFPKPHAASLLHHADPFLPLPTPTLTLPRPPHAQSVHALLRQQPRSLPATAPLHLRTDLRPDIRALPQQPQLSGDGEPLRASPLVSPLGSGPPPLARPEWEGVSVADAEALAPFCHSAVWPMTHPEELDDVPLDTSWIPEECVHLVLSGESSAETSPAKARLPAAPQPPAQHSPCRFAQPQAADDSFLKLEFPEL